MIYDIVVDLLALNERTREPARERDVQRNFLSSKLTLCLTKTIRELSKNTFWDPGDVLGAQKPLSKSKIA